MTQQNQPVNPGSSAAATDVGEFVSDLDGGIFDRKLSIALSQVAAAVVDQDKAGEVSIAFSFKKIPGTSQVHCEHRLKFTKPTLDGKAGEEEKRTTALHVGKFGRLTLAPETQMSFMDRAGNLST
ncbi:hypothetical protein APR50_32675 [Variovorax paradoxus]|jgi:hypothetical protein|uniref:hypothetical protein n=1 Tax=Variovorax paradoxus TaxID=34073 RepID=UPI0006E71305|nr:hypothetical protein APR52_13920 [Variovorax paradoxus]KPV00475.1 hypothetical protein APR50_32675 [Variovorax paradoxus]KPV08068.1 hypothetical protein APR49_15990 [Variovorax paradoxus]KPV22531.1 hypothetical protein APR51_09985 [Variovorax paradoxus]KPV35398.1 hypothetical protein APR48_04465 [Variovorax paradoxus]